VQIGGTSASAPQLSATVAIVNQDRALLGFPTLNTPGYNQTLPELYKLYQTTPADFHDITSGNNGYPATAGYDLVTGTGTPVANTFIPDLASIDTNLMATATTPAAGSFVTMAPTAVTVHFNYAIDSATIIRTDFTLDGVAPTSAVQDGSDPNTVDLTWATSPATGYGPQNVSVAAGAVKRLSDENPTLPFSDTFYYGTQVQEVSTNPASGALLNLPGDLIVNFSGAITASSVSTSNLVLNEGTVTSASLVPGHPTEVDYRIVGPQTADGTTLTVTMATGALVDTFGNPVLGFSTSYQANVPVSAYPIPLTGIQPLGSLIYDPSVSGTVGFVGDTDSFTIALNNGQTASVSVTPGAGLQAIISLYNPTNQLVATATASAAGQEVFLQTVPIAQAGTYTLTVSAANGTTGTYTTQLVLNAALETESNGGPAHSNDTIATAQSLASSFGSLGSGISRGAVLGSFAGALSAGDVFVSERGGPGVLLLDPSGNVITTFTDPSLSTGTVQYVALGTDNTVYVGLDTSSGQGQGEVLHFSSFGTLLGTINLPTISSNGHYYPFGLTVASDGSLWVTEQANGLVDHLSSTGTLIRSYNVGGTPEDVAIRSDGQVFVSNGAFGDIQQLDPASGNVTTFASTYYGVPLGLRFAPGGNLVVADLYDIEQIDTSGNIVYDVFDPYVLDAQVDPSGVLWATNVFGEVDRFDASGNFVGYSLTAGAPIGLAIVGSDSPAPTGLDGSDYYSFTLTRGQSASIVLSALAGRGATFDLEDSSGTELAIPHADANNGAGLSINNFVAQTAGTYYIHVSRPGGAAEQYSVVVTTGADFDTGPNQSLATPQPLLGAQSVLGYGGTSEVTPAAAKVLYYADFTTNDTFAQAFANLGITPTVASSYSDFESNLASGHWDLVVLMNQGYYDTTWQTPLINYVDAGGHAIMASWNPQGSSAAVAQAFGANYTGGTDETSVNQTVSSPIWSGVSNPYQLFNFPGYGVFSTGLAATTGQAIGAFPSGDGALVVGNSGHTILNGFLSDVGLDSSQSIQLEENEINSLLIAQRTDSYSFTAKAHDVVTLSTTTPIQGARQPGDTFDPKILLYGPNGTLVASNDNGAADGRNALLQYTIPTGSGGTYVAEVVASPLTPAPTAGEYTLSISGNRPAATAFTSSPSIAPNSTVFAAPTITVDFSAPIYLPSLSAAALTIDGLAATGFVIDNDHEVTFTLPAFTATGHHVVHTVNIANTIQDLQGDRLAVFNEKFYVDNLPPELTKSSIAEGDKVTSGTFTYTATFDDVIDASNLSTASFHLHGLYHNADYTPVSYSLDATGKVLTLQFSGLPDDAYTLTLYSQQAADGGPVTDGHGLRNIVGTSLDGEPHSPYSLPSGDGVAGGNFSVDFRIDSPVTTAFPTPLAAVNPLGSLVYQGSVTNVITTAAEVDAYTINLDGGQAITLDLTTGNTLQGWVGLYNGKTLIASATASAAGSEVVLQTQAIAANGNYTIKVEGANNTAGLYTLGVTLNAALDAAVHGGSNNSTIATAQSLNSAFLTLGLHGASDAAVLGSTTVPFTPASGDVFVSERYGGPGVLLLDPSGNVLETFTDPSLSTGTVQFVSLGVNDDVYVGLDTTGSGNGGEVLHFTAGGTLLGTITLPNDASSGLYYPFGFEVAADGTLWVPQPNSGNVIHVDASGNLIQSYNVGGTPEDVAIRSDGQVFISNPAFGDIQQLDPASGNVTTFAYTYFGVPLGLHFAPGGNLVVADFYDVEQIDTSGNIVYDVFDFGANDAQVDPSGVLSVANFVFGEVDRFDASGNFVGYSFTPGSPIGLAIVGSDCPVPTPPVVNNYYSFTAAAGQDVTVTLTDLNGSPVTLSLLNASGTVLATATTSTTNVNQLIANYVGAGGTYYIEVTGTVSGTTQYSLLVTRSADFAVDPDSSMATAQNLGATTGELGAITTSSPTRYYSEYIGDTGTIVLTTFTPGSAPGATNNTLTPHIVLENSSGTVVATGVKLADGRNETLTWTVPHGQGGTYYVVVSGQNGTTGEFYLDDPVTYPTATLPAAPVPAFDNPRSASRQVSTLAPATLVAAAGTPQTNAAVAALNSGGFAGSVLDASTQPFTAAARPLSFGSGVPLASAQTLDSFWATGSRTAPELWPDQMIRADWNERSLFVGEQTTSDIDPFDLVNEPVGSPRSDVWMRDALFSQVPDFSGSPRDLDGGTASWVDEEGDSGKGDGE
jgi:streptogramin lyase